MSPPVVVLDACTLYPAALRDVLMRLSLHGLIAARWTDAIHDEWIEAVLRDRPDLTREQLGRTRDLSLKRPPLTAGEYLQTLRRQGLEQTCTFLERVAPHL